ncbi:MAG: hypothetical protein Q8R28_17080 [Dehalococcoidia bacterium]|nr:hypothetical protein [Dehalococcoidia bacterium]
MVSETGEHGRCGIGDQTVSSKAVSPEADLKGQARRYGAVVCGIASVDEINQKAPEGHRPTDILPGARSVVVLAGRPPLRGAWRSANPRVIGLLEGSTGMQGPSVRLAAFIEVKYGHDAVLMPPGYGAGHTPLVSTKLMAEMAGLGTRSMAGAILLNPDHGFLYYSASVTTMPLVPDEPLREGVCPAPSCVRIWEKKGTTPCLQACPMCLSGELEDGRIKWMEYNQLRCHTRAQTSSVDAFIKTLLGIVEEPDPHERKLIAFGSRFRHCVENMAFSSELVGQCFECMRDCPASRTRRPSKPR